MRLSRLERPSAFKRRLNVDVCLMRIIYSGIRKSLLFCQLKAIRTGNIVFSISNGHFSRTNLVPTALMLTYYLIRTVPCTPVVTNWEIVFSDRNSTGKSQIDINYTTSVFRKWPRPLISAVT